MRILILLLMASLSYADPVSITAEWDAPTTRENGDALASSEIAGYIIYYSVDGTVDVGSDSVTVQTGSTEVVTLDLPPRDAPYRMSVAMIAVDSRGLRSKLSNVETQEFVITSTSPPSVPTNIKFVFSCNPDCLVEVMQ